MMPAAELGALYETELLEQVVKFWETHSIDNENGGFFTCLTETGEVFDTDKFIWLQGREIWTFATMYNTYGDGVVGAERRKGWLDIARRGADFLIEKGFDPATGRFFFSVDASGNPLVAPYNIFSDCFACMAFAALYTATHEDRYKDLATRTFDTILANRHDTKGRYNKAISGTGGRALKGFSLPMILCNLSIELEGILGSDQVDALSAEVKREVLEDFYKPDFGCGGIILESVNALDGSFSDTFDGRLINPGHGIESTWFLMDLAERSGDDALFEKACDILIKTLEFGWDAEYGGIFYFLDAKNRPPDKLEWDQKLWWVHCECLVALAKAFRRRRVSLYWDWFLKVHEYTWSKFRDLKRGGEWFGYLNRRGEVSLRLKGGKWKGCFHVPRCLLKVSQELAKCL